MGIYKGTDDDDDDINNCTVLLDKFTMADAGHTEYDLGSVPIWASPADVEIYRHRIKANEQMGEGLTMIAIANQFWLWQLEQLSTNVTIMHIRPKCPI